ncbi:MAG: hypothetical protein A2Y17_00250 [Clostridiales bacterium GWF2_38_85]|nr:MAG: hypothetical protein A2Y17_00250 [Clostridiales bacterium GWF2_38_85]HBL83891.1 hypothetical protein [Clostridiales bacterium]
MTVKAFVLNTESEDALVVVRRKSACVSCTTGCIGCSKGKEHRAVAINKIGAKSGDIVNVFYPNVNAATFTIFMLPIILAILTYFLVLPLGTDYASALSFVSLIAGFVALYVVVGRIMYKFSKLEITEVLSSEEK